MSEDELIDRIRELDVHIRPLIELRPNVDEGN
jgi:hypothetical protein